MGHWSNKYGVSLYATYVLHKLESFIDDVTKVVDQYNSLEGPEQPFSKNRPSWSMTRVMFSFNCQHTT